MEEMRLMAALLCVAAGFAQTKPARKLTARELFHGAPETTKEAPGPAATPKRPAAILASAPAIPLGLRYSILKETQPGATAEVDAAGVFRSGERIRLTVQTNADAYLYIVLRGSSQSWSVLFPSAEVAGGDNFLRRGARQEVPAGHWFTFDDRPGTERLFLVLSRQPVTDLEKLIYAVREAPSAGRPAKTLLAAGRPIDDALIGRIREKVYTRDLIFEKVDEKEKAVYAVEGAGGADSRVVVEIALEHR